MLFRKQRNEFFEALVTAGFAVSDFKEKWDDSNRYEVALLKDKQFNYELLDSNSSAQFKVSFSPTTHTVSNAVDIHDWKPWANAVKVFA